MKILWSSIALQTDAVLLNNPHFIVIYLVLYKLKAVSRFINHKAVKYFDQPSNLRCDYSVIDVALQT